jgi:hypothetical protein
MTMLSKAECGDDYPDGSLNLMVHPIRKEIKNDDKLNQSAIRETETRGDAHRTKNIHERRKGITLVSIG